MSTTTKLLKNSRCSNSRTGSSLAPSEDGYSSNFRNNIQLEHRGSRITRHRVNGGGERDRTDDPLLAKQVLSQLSYTPGKARITSAPPEGRNDGGSGWTRTIDPRLIKTVL